MMTSSDCPGGTRCGHVDGSRGSQVKPGFDVSLRPTADSLSKQSPVLATVTVSSCTWPMSTWPKSIDVGCTLICGCWSGWQSKSLTGSHTSNTQISSARHSASEPQPL